MVVKEIEERLVDALDDLKEFNYSHGSRVTSCAAESVIIVSQS